MLQEAHSETAFQVGPKSRRNVIRIIDSKEFASASRPSGADFRVMVPGSAFVQARTRAPFDPPLMFSRHGARNVNVAICARGRDVVGKAGGPPAPTKNIGEMHAGAGDENVS